jgi:hypothetical protein
VRTDELIAALAADLRPVRRVPSPAVCLMVWLAAGFINVAAVLIWMGVRADLADRLADAWWLTEQGTIAATAIVACYAAYCSTLPDRPRWLAGLAAAAGILWLAILGAGCIAAWLRLGPDGLAIAPDALCFPKIALVGLGPAIVVAWLARRAVPFRPATTMALGALGAAALGDFGLRLFHPIDASVMVLIWQAGSVALLTAIGALAGPALLGRAGPKAAGA